LPPTTAANRSIWELGGLVTLELLLQLLHQLGDVGDELLVPATPPQSGHFLRGVRLWPVGACRPNRDVRHFAIGSSQSTGATWFRRHASQPATPGNRVRERGKGWNASRRQIGRSRCALKRRGVTPDPLATANKGREAREERSGISGLPLYVAIAAIALWAVFVVVMFLLSDSGETRWTRAVYIFGSVEAIAFAAAGALFGVTVQRERVDRAEKKADANEKDAASGRALAAVNLADGGQVVDQDGESRYEAFGAEDARDADVRRRHAEAARRLFPDL
jgi:hypothetical protein